MNDSPAVIKPRLLVQWLSGIFLFAATAAVVVWQNSRVGVLWDLSYILENANRMALGDMPYRDFPFPYAPVTFLVQAAIIKTTGAVFWHHIVYSALIGGLGTVVIWLILRRVLARIVPWPRTAAFLLSVPVIVLGIYCVFPHPFYDPDCTFVILLSILALLWLDDHKFPPVGSFLCGVLVVLPVFIKQNTGLAFLASIGVGLVLLIGVNLWRREPVRGLLLLIAGIAAGLAAGLTIIYCTAGLDNYKHWTIDFAASRRTPSAAEMLSVYADWGLAGWLGLFGLGALVLRFLRRKHIVWPIVAIVLMMASFAWPIIYLCLDPDPSERAERFVAVWPMAIVLSLVSVLLMLRRRRGIRSILPFVILGVAHGAFLSQQLWGSTYALWPLLMILLAMLIGAFFELFEFEGGGPVVMTICAVIAVSLTISGTFYIYANERLDYVNLDDGELQHSGLPALAGLNIRGEYLTDFAELVDYTDKNIPREDGILMLPGEDLFYYTTGRKPQFPVLMFDHTVNPLNSDEIIQTARERNINWVIVKNDLQLDENPLEDKDRLMELIKQDFKHVDGLNNYEIFRRRQPGEVDDEDDDSGDGNDSGDDPGDDGGDESPD